MMRFCTAILVTVATGCAGSLSLNPLASVLGPTNSRAQQTMPELVGISRVDAQARLATARLTQVRWLVHRCPDRRVPVGSVCSTMPSADSWASPRTRVTIWVQAPPRRRPRGRNQRDLRVIRKAKGEGGVTASSVDIGGKSIDRSGEDIDSKTLGTPGRSDGASNAVTKEGGHTATKKEADKKPPAKKDYF